MCDYLKKFLIHLFILFILTLPFWFSNLDIVFSSFFYNKTSGWYLFNNKIIVLLYKYGTYPAIIFSIFLIFVLTLQKIFKSSEDLKKIAVVFLITLIFAPGIIINVLLKNYTGRPRPREIVEFNGKWEYKRVLQLGKPGKGYSFPCGHCSMGFIFCSVYFVLRNKRKILANVSLWTGIIYGIIMGIGRIAQGAHFLSDVIWAGGITIITSEIVYYLLFENKRNYIVDFLIDKKIPIIPAIILSSVLVLILFLFFLMSVPFYREHKIDMKIKNNVLRFVFNGTGDLKINETENASNIFISASGFGFPRSNFYWTYDINEKDMISDIVFNTYQKGFFQELTANIDINLSHNKNSEIIINNINGNIECELPAYTSKCVLFTKKGDIFLNINGIIKELFIKNLKGNIYLNLNKDAYVEPNSLIAINATSGMVEIKNQSNYLKELNDSAKEITGSKELYFQNKKTGHLYMNINAKKIIVK
ncbi:MAG: phosphatase PAP2 family protein [Candidatus Goldbacteria bacterium]|nr:phosphatase PAP2 family protein [Candidatus Goldiibacteriota bacterium]